MLSDNPGALPSPQAELASPQLPQPVHQQRAIPSRALALRVPTDQLQDLEDGSSSHTPQEHQLERRAVTPNLTPSHRSSQQYPTSTLPYSLAPLSEYHSGFTDEDLGPPCLSPTPFSGQINHRRQHSFPNLLPLTLRSRTPSPTRKTHRRFPSEQMPFTGDGRKTNAARTAAAAAAAADGNPRGGLAGWLSGTAAAASALGISLNNATPETRNQSNGTTASNGSALSACSNSNITSITTPTDATPNRLQRATAASAVGSSSSADPVTPKPNTPGGTMTSRFMSAISSRFTTPSAQSTQSAAALDDEILNLNIEQALFPSSSSSPQDRDTFSPAAFKNFQMNAIGLLSKIQAAYKDRVIAIRDLEAERSAQKDEMEEAETRAQHLKFQLEGMAAKAAEQERAMKSLMDELNAERKARQQLTIIATSKAASVVSEDLGVDEIDRDRRRRKRKSADSRSFDSDEEEEDEIASAESESVFSISRCRSPANTTITNLTMPSLPLIQHATNNSVPDSPPRPVSPAVVTPITRVGTGGFGSVNGTPRQRTGVNGTPGQMSAFQKIFKGISGGDPVNGCLNCKGQDASVAWDTVGLLRDENRHLKGRVSELEVAVEGALDVVRGIGL